MILALVKLRFTSETRARGFFARLSPPAKIKDFVISPRRADSLCSPKRCFFGGKATEKTDFIY